MSSQMEIGRNFPVNNASLENAELLKTKIFLSKFSGSLGVGFLVCLGIFFGGIGVGTFFFSPPPQPDLHDLFCGSFCVALP